MPTFDFRCLKCDTVFEFARPFGSKTTPACPKCKSKRTEKQITPPAVHFKGSGWYKTDSMKSAPSTTAAPPKKDEKPADTAPDPAPASPKPDKTDAPKTAPKKAKEGV
jgi:putative FmdB family regulatory protein